MKHEPSNNKFQIFSAIVSFLFLSFFIYAFYVWRGDYLVTNQLNSIKSARPITHVVNDSTNTISVKSSHLISIFVGTTCTMQISADSFYVKDNILFYEALGRKFYILGSMHSIVVEEIKQGVIPITQLSEKQAPNNQPKQ